MENIDYNKLLDDWAEKIYEKADKCSEERKYEPTGTWRDGYLKGLNEAYIMAISMLNCEERKYKRKIKRIQKQDELKVEINISKL